MLFSMDRPMMQGNIEYQSGWIDVIVTPPSRKRRSNRGAINVGHHHRYLRHGDLCRVNSRNIIGIRRLFSRVFHLIQGVFSRARGGDCGRYYKMSPTPSAYPTANFYRLIDRFCLSWLHGLEPDFLTASIYFAEVPNITICSSATISQRRSGDFFGKGQEQYLRFAFANAEIDAIKQLPERLSALKI